MIRRAFKRDNLMYPDSEHLHSRLYKFLQIKMGNNCETVHLNSLTSVLLLLPLFGINSMSFILIDKANFDLTLFALVVLGQILIFSLLSELLRRKIKVG